MKTTLSAGRLKGILIYAVLLLYAAWAGTACSVKEDRSDCPCLLSIYPDPGIDPDKFKIFGNTFLIRDLQSGEKYAHGLLSFDTYSYIPQRAVTLRIPKSRVSLCSVFSSSGAADEFITIPDGCQADSVFVHLSAIDCTGETAQDTLRLLKQWCSLYIHLDDSNRYSEGDVRLEGRWNGFEAATLTPSPGIFNFAPDTLSRNRFMIRLPRQADESLALEVRDPDSDYIKTYPLGEYIAKSRYDWKKHSLDDIIVYIDNSSVRIEVLTMEWNNGTDYGTVEF